MLRPRGLTVAAFSRGGSGAVPAAVEDLVRDELATPLLGAPEAARLRVHVRLALSEGDGTLGVA